MFKITTTKVLVLGLVLSIGAIKYLDHRVDTLKTNLETAEQSVKRQNETILDVKKSLTQMNGYIDNLRNSVDDLSAENKSLKGTLKYKDQLLSDKKLSDEVVKQSFQKFSDDLREVTK